MSLPPTALAIGLESVVEFFTNTLLSASGFMPHGHCYLWRPEVLWLHVLSDAAIAAAYYVIPVILIYFIRKRRDLPFSWAFVLFGAFILACGTTHILGVLTVWQPVYWLDGAMKFVTAVLSVATAVALIPLMPKAIALPSPGQLAEVNRQLAAENSERSRAEADLARRAVELRTAYEKLQDSERLKDEFFANVSHELRTPLALILAPVEALLAQRSAAVAGSGRELRSIHNNALRLLQLVDGLLDFAKLEAGKLEPRREPTPVVAFVAGILDDFQPLMRERGLTASLQPALDRDLLAIDRHLFERIVFNLLANATKFTPAGGRICVRLTRFGERLNLAVEDTGIGIAVDQQPLLFQKFRQIAGSRTRAISGTGLGLAMVKEFAESLGGSAHVRSQLGEGSVFSVEIVAPLVSAEAEGVAPIGGAARRIVSADLLGLAEARVALAPSPQPTDAPAAGAAPIVALPTADVASGSADRPKILIAEDNAELAGYIRTALGDGYEFRLAFDGEAALAEIARGWQPDLILSDVMMAKLDGLALCERIRSDPQTCAIPVVLLTAMTHRAALIQGWQVGASDYLFKPFFAEELRHRVGLLVAAQRARAEALRQKVAREQAEVATAIAQAHILQLAQKEAELRRINRVKDEFLATVSHELRTPMNAILGWAELLQSGQVETGEAAAAAEVIHRNARSQAKLIEDLLDISRIISGKIKLGVRSVRLAPVIASAVDSLRFTAEAKGVTLALSGMDSELAVRGDPDRLQQIVWNVVANAIKFTGSGGHVDVSLQSVDAAVHIVVSDNGEGIDADFLPFVFERFLQEKGDMTRQHGGLGLGLSIVKHLTELHGGTVAATSSGKGAGSTFRVALPVVSRDVWQKSATKAESAPTATAPVAPELYRPLLGMRVLVVDDDKDARQLVAKVLRLAGAEVYGADSAATAGPLWQRHAPDALVSDLSMPHEDGCQLLVRLQSYDPEQRIAALALSAHAQQEAQAKAAAAGFQIYLAKPAQPEAIVQAVVRLVHGKATA